MPFQIDLDGHADHWIVVYDENAWHVVVSWLGVLSRPSCKSRVSLHAGLPSNCYSKFAALRRPPTALVLRSPRITTTPH
jgi:hypothetical protein